jgi:hypothetical protein
MIKNCKYREITETKYTQTHVSSKLIKLFSKWKGLKIVGVNPTVPK